MSRHFTYEQAISLLPEVERLLRSAMSAYRRYLTAENEIAIFTKRVSESGGMQPNMDRARHWRAERDSAGSEVKNSLETIGELGVQIKDLSTGLVDFPTLYQGEEVLLCWRMGERTIEYWHSIDDGFAGRRKIDREFLTRHSGSETQ